MYIVFLVDSTSFSAFFIAMFALLDNSIRVLLLLRKVVLNVIWCVRNEIAVMVSSITVK